VRWFVSKHVISARIVIERYNVIHGLQPNRIFTQVRNTRGGMPEATTLAKLHHIEEEKREMSP
jgi:hypothetical protein